MNFLSGRNRILFIIFILLIFGFAGYFFISQGDNVQLGPQGETITPTSSAEQRDITPTPESLPTPSPSPTPSPEQREEIYQNHNVYGVKNFPTAETYFTLSSQRRIYSIETYHWNNARGKKPGEISLEGEDGTIYGPWPAEGRDGQGGVPNAYWTCYPDTVLSAGTYRVIDSDVTSWSQNAQSGGKGMVRVYAVIE